MEYLKYTILMVLVIHKIYLGLIVLYCPKSGVPSEVGTF